jgi:hypothetical protein
MLKINKYNWLSNDGGYLRDENNFVVENQFGSFTLWGRHDAFRCSKCRRIYLTTWTFNNHQCKGICNVRYPNMHSCSGCGEVCSKK